MPPPLLFEDFEDSTVTYTLTPSESLDNLAIEDYFGRVQTTLLPADYSYTGIQGSYFFGASDTDSASPNASSTVTLDWTGLNITGLANPTFSGLFGEDDDGLNEDWDITSSVIVSVQIDGGGYIPIFAIESSSASVGNTAPRVDTDFDGVGDGAEITDTLTLFSQSIFGFNGLPLSGTTLDLRITITDLDTGDEDIAIDNITITCFLGGSMIATPDGERAVETLAIGDLVLTADGRAVPVRWLGRQTLRKHHGLPEKMEPVRIRAGALGGGCPHSDLMVTADHGMIIDGLVVNAGALVNGDSINFVPHAELRSRFKVYHVETEAHDIILANGAPTETFIDYVGRQGFDNYREYLDLYGCDRVIPEMPHPRISSRQLLPMPLRERLGAPPFDAPAEQDIRLRTAPPSAA